MKLSYIRSLAVGLFLTAFTAINTTAAETWLFKVKPYDPAMTVLASEDTKPLTEALVDAWRKSAHVTNVNVRMSSPPVIIDDMVFNRAEIAVLPRDVRFMEATHYWGNAQRAPITTVICYTHDLQHQPISVLVDRPKADRWSGFPEFCKTDAAQKIVKSYGYDALAYKDRP